MEFENKVRHATSSIYWYEGFQFSSYKNHLLKKTNE